MNNEWQLSGVLKQKYFYPLVLAQQEVYIKKVIYRPPVTIVLWSDGTKTTSRCSSEDIYSRECGLAVATLKKITGSKFVKETLQDWCNTETDTITIADVRRANKCSKKFG